jgi:putative hydrolase of the HAD superfamily
VIFDLGGTLVHWPDWDDAAPLRWGASYDRLVRALPREDWPARDGYVRAMREAELAHWRRVDAENWSGPPSGVVAEGFRLPAHPTSQLMACWTPRRCRGRLGGVTRRVRRRRCAGAAIGWGCSPTPAGGAWHDADLATQWPRRVPDELVTPPTAPPAAPFRLSEVAGRLGVEPDACVMIGDRMVDDVGGAARECAPSGDATITLAARRGIKPSAVVTWLSNSPPLQTWSGR